jgi:hypothetical protein
VLCNLLQGPEFMFSRAMLSMSLNKMEAFAKSPDVYVSAPFSERVYRQGEATVLPVRYNDAWLRTEA